MTQLGLLVKLYAKKSKIKFGIKSARDFFEKKLSFCLQFSFI